MGRVNVFVSSPTDGLEEYRYEVTQFEAALNAKYPENPRYKFFLYEYFQDECERDYPDETPVQRIMRSFNKECPEGCHLFLLFHKKRGGSGTLEEVDVFLDEFSKNDCKLWWFDIDCSDKGDADYERIRKKLFASSYRHSPLLKQCPRIASPLDFCRNLHGLWQRKLSDK